MPIYDYECPDHGEFELIRFINDETPVFCPRCNSKSKKLPSMFAITSRKTTIGANRQELFDNLAKEGNGHKDWRHYDSYYHHATGNEDALNA